MRKFLLWILLSPFAFAVFFRTIDRQLIEIRPAVAKRFHILPIDLSKSLGYFDIPLGKQDLIEFLDLLASNPQKFHSQFISIAKGLGVDIFETSPSLDELFNIWRYNPTDFGFAFAPNSIQGNTLSETEYGNIQIVTNLPSGKTCFFRKFELGSSAEYEFQLILRMKDYAKMLGFYGYCIMDDTFHLITEYYPLSLSHFLQTGSFPFEGPVEYASIISSVLLNVAQMVMEAHRNNVLFGTIKEDLLFFSSKDSLKFLPYRNGIREKDMYMKEFFTLDSFSIIFLPPDIQEQHLTLTDKNSDFFRFGHFVYRIAMEQEIPQISPFLWFHIDSLWAVNEKERAKNIDSFFERPLKFAFHLTCSCSVSIPNAELEAPWKNHFNGICSAPISRKDSFTLQELNITNQLLLENLYLIYNNTTFSQSSYKHFSFTRMANTEHQLFICGNFTINKCLPMHKKGSFTFQISFYAFEEALYTIYFFGYKLLEKWEQKHLNNVPKKAAYLIDPSLEYSSELEHWLQAIEAL
jgi:hypothetical protein